MRPRFGQPQPCATAIQKTRSKPLGPPLAYAMRDFHIPSLLGAAYLAAGMPVDAEGEYRRILDNPGIDPLSRRDDSLREYQRFFDDWKSADADLPVMKKARDEYAALASAH